MEQPRDVIWQRISSIRPLSHNDLTKLELAVVSHMAFLLGKM